MTTPRASAGVRLPVTAIALFAMFVSASVARAADPIDFERDVLPIFEARCFECHSAPKRDDRGRMGRPKGNLRLDGAGFIRQAMREMKAIVPNQPDASLILEVVRLPGDDPDALPPKADRLTSSQIATIERWIREGATFGQWTGVAGGDPAPTSSGAADASSRQTLWRRLATGATPIPTETLETLTRETKARIEPIAPGSPLLRVAFPSVEKTVDDIVVAKLAPLASNIAVLDLRRTRITDAALRSIETLPRLVRLDLSETAITAKALDRVRKSPELRSLVLVKTQVGDDLDVTPWPQLESLYLWKSAVTKARIEELVNRHPKLSVHAEPALPSPAEPTSDRRRRRP